MCDCAPAGEIPPENPHIPRCPFFKISIPVGGDHFYFSKNSYPCGRIFLNLDLKIPPVTLKNREKEGKLHFQSISLLNSRSGGPNLISTYSPQELISPENIQILKPSYLLNQSRYDVLNTFFGNYVF